MTRRGNPGYVRWRFAGSLRGPDVDRLSYVVCARSEVSPADTDTIVITAADIFPDPQ
jgi:hypothetical protein